MITFNDATKIILGKYKDSIVTSVLDGNSYWIVALRPKKFKNGEYALDPYFKVDKKTGKISEYSTAMNPKEFKNAAVVYSLKKR